MRLSQNSVQRSRSGASAGSFGSQFFGGLDLLVFYWGQIEGKRKVSQIVGFLFGREFSTEIVQLRWFAALVNYNVVHLAFTI